MNTPQPTSPRRRLQELQAIPDSQRTDAEWDELHELEIMLAPGNQVGGPENYGRRHIPGPSGGGPKHGGLPKHGGMAKHGGGMPKRAGGPKAGGAPRHGGGPRPNNPPSAPPPAEGGSAPEAAAGGAPVAAGGPGTGGTPGGPGKKPARKFHKRPPKPKAPPAE
jgi:hypothetical protein